jgi:hypothetical protein
MDSQNFNVHRCSEINAPTPFLSEQIVVITSHFKSKAPDHLIRMRLGKALQDYLQFKTNIDETIILTGDLNSEIDEVATIINQPICRYIDGKPFAIKPNPCFNEMLTFNQCSKGKSKLNDFVENLGNKNKEKEKLKNKHLFNIAEYFTSNIAEIEKDIKKYEQEISEYLSEKLSEDKNIQYAVWYETSSHPTESKSRIKETDYFNKKLFNLELSKSITNEDLKKIYDEFMNKLNFPNFKELAVEEYNKSESAVVKQFKEDNKSLKYDLNSDDQSDEALETKRLIIRTIKESIFVDYLQKLLKLKRDIVETNMDKSQFSNVNSGSYFDELSKTIFNLDQRKGKLEDNDKYIQISTMIDAANAIFLHQEKIDFILVRPGRFLKLSKKDENIKIPEVYFEKGVNNNSFSSDHMPSYDTITIERVPASSLGTDKLLI